ncbi:uncharacterized protein LOC102807919 [Saccoglossus kowalevskii]|uniref:Uncharacterized protein LOC102807919 n=1 Tax=Saccoglossus kowalevskii TaxID=10224 RepID=A0ABM0LVE0_SACKO|nr:PREDICTED: uncharacterized protein LOC102807919 [Saccoglossus kowalevskii]
MMNVKERKRIVAELLSQHSDKPPHDVEERKRIVNELLAQHDEKLKKKKSFGNKSYHNCERLISPHTASRKRSAPLPVVEQLSIPNNTVYVESVPMVNPVLEMNKSTQPCQKLICASSVQVSPLIASQSLITINPVPENGVHTAMPIEMNMDTTPIENTDSVFPVNLSDVSTKHDGIPLVGSNPSLPGISLMNQPYLQDNSPLVVSVVLDESSVESPEHGSHMNASNECESLQQLQPCSIVTKTTKATTIPKHKSNATAKMQCKKMPFFARISFKKWTYEGKKYCHYPSSKFLLMYGFNPHTCLEMSSNHCRRSAMNCQALTVADFMELYYTSEKIKDYKLNITIDNIKISKHYLLMLLWLEHFFGVTISSSEILSISCLVRVKYEALLRVYKRCKGCNDFKELYKLITYLQSDVFTATTASKGILNRCNYAKALGSFCKKSIYCCETCQRESLKAKLNQPVLKTNENSERQGSNNIHTDTSLDSSSAVNQSQSVVYSYVVEDGKVVLASKTFGKPRMNSTAMQVKKEPVDAGTKLKAHYSEASNVCEVAKKILASHIPEKSYTLVMVVHLVVVMVVHLVVVMMVHLVVVMVVHLVVVMVVHLVVVMVVHLVVVMVVHLARIFARYAIEHTKQNQCVKVDYYTLPSPKLLLLAGMCYETCKTITTSTCRPSGATFPSLTFKDLLELRCTAERVCSMKGLYITIDGLVTNNSMSILTGWLNHFFGLNHSIASIRELLGHAQETYYCYLYRQPDQYHHSSWHDMKKYLNSHISIVVNFAAQYSITSDAAFKEMPFSQILAKSAYANILCVVAETNNDIIMFGSNHDHSYSTDRQPIMNQQANKPTSTVSGQSGVSRDVESVNYSDLQPPVHDIQDNTEINACVQSSIESCSHALPTHAKPEMQEFSTDCQVNSGISMFIGTKLKNRWNRIKRLLSSQEDRDMFKYLLDFYDVMCEKDSDLEENPWQYIDNLPISSVFTKFTKKDKKTVADIKEYIKENESRIRTSDRSTYAQFIYAGDTKPEITETMETIIQEEQQLEIDIYEDMNDVCFVGDV